MIIEPLPPTYAVPMALDAQSVLHRLMTMQPTALEHLPDEHGVYALHDHLGQIRYIGMTTAEKVGFRNRINSRHVSGSEERSHKYSHAYNTGRMWRSREPLASQRDTDAKLAKSLRIAFCRQYCRASYVAIPGNERQKNYSSGLRRLEKQVQAIAPPEMRRWERTHFRPENEPTDFVDTLIQKLNLSDEWRAAIDRQAELASGEQ